MFAKITIIFPIVLWTMLNYGMIAYMLYEYLLYPDGPWHVLRGTCCKPIQRIPLYIHMVGAVVMILLGPVQLLNEWCKTRFHPYIGGVYVLGAVMNSVGGIVFMNFNETVGGPSMTVPFTVSGVLVFNWAMITMTLGLYRLKKYHKLWVFRMFFLGTASTFYRLLYIGTFIIYGRYRPTFTEPLDQAYNWLFFIVPMFVCEIGLFLYYRCNLECFTRCRYCWSRTDRANLIILPEEGSSESPSSSRPELRIYIQSEEQLLLS